MLVSVLFVYSSHAAATTPAYPHHFVDVSNTKGNWSYEFEGEESLVIWDSPINEFSDYLKMNVPKEIGDEILLYFYYNLVL